jgi:ferrous iron transport protein A
MKTIFISPSLPPMAIAPEPALAPSLLLSDLPPGRRGTIVALDGSGPIGKRLGDLGFVPGTEIAAIRRAPLGDPTAYALRGCEFALRRSEAMRVRVRAEAPA